MATSWRRWCSNLGLTSFLVISGTLAFSGTPTVAQIIPDTTLPVNSTVTPQGKTTLINGGTRAGGNLFHSFSQFSVPTGNTAHFNNAYDVRNIFTRVTGGSVSNIDGILFTNGTANLFLLNPNGIIFGANASLNVGGSFVATTANAIGFGNLGVFSASSTDNNPSLLTVNPSVFLFNRLAVQPNNSIENRGNLAVNQGNSLLLLGGNISPSSTETGGILIDGSSLQENSSSLKAPGGRVEVGAVGTAATVGLSIDPNNTRLMSLSFPLGVERTDVSLVNAANLDVEAGNGGSIAINAKNLNMEGESNIQAGIKSGMGNINSLVGDIDINATEAITLNNHSWIFNRLLGSSVGNGGNVKITTGSLSLLNGSYLDATTLGHGNAGSITISALNKVYLDGGYAKNYSGIFSNVDPGGMGTGGSINIMTNALSLTNGAEINSVISGQGNAGSIIIEAKDSIVIDGVNSSNRTSSGIYSVVNVQSIGNGGSVNIKSGSFSVSNGAQISSATLGQGDAGNIFVNVTQDILFTNFSNITTVVGPGSEGKGGDIDITARRLSLTSGSQLAASVLPYQTINFIVVPGGRGKGGDIRVNATEEVILSGVSTFKYPILNPLNHAIIFSTEGYSSGLITNTARGASGSGGNIQVLTPILRVQDGAVINAQTLNSSNGGNVTIQVNNFEAVNGGQVLTTTRSGGKAGNIILNAIDGVTITGSDPTFTTRFANFGIDVVDNEGSASGLFSNADTNSTNSGGNIILNTRNLNISNGSGIFVNNQGAGNAGNLQLQAADSIKIENIGTISAETRSGEGGNINLTTNFLQLRNNSTVTATAKNQGNGGNININAGFITAVPSENSDITANAFAGKGGNIQISTQGIFGITANTSQTLNSNITASSQLGVNGTIQINTPGVDPSRGLVTLPANLFDASRLIAQRCAAVEGENASKFVVTGRGGLPPNPGETLSRKVIWEDASNNMVTATQHRPSTVTVKPQSEPDVAQLVPATGWVFDDKGKVTLTAAAPARINNFSSNSTTCANH